jgi:2'-5' RNA ligase
MNIRYKYLIVVRVPEPANKIIRSLMDKVSGYTGTDPLYKKLFVHITLHKPLYGIEEEKLKNIISSVVQKMERATVGLASFHPFGRQYIVLPVIANTGFMIAFIELVKLIMPLRDYEHGEYDFNNTLHITIAEKISPIFSRIWPHIHKMPYRALEFELTTLALLRKPIHHDGLWEVVQEFIIP